MTGYLTIPELFEQTLERSADKTWLYFEDSAYTYGDAQDRIVAIGSALADLGVGRETRIVATAGNSPEYLLGWLAVVRLGATFVPVNPKSTSGELAGLIGQVEPPVVITDEDLRATVDAALGEVNSKAQVVLAGDLFKAPSVDAPPPAAREGDVAVMIPTSGTTGRSKLVMQTQRAYAMAGEGFPWWMGLNEDDILMTSLPLFHINAPAYSTLGSIAAGAGLVVLPRFSASTFIDS
ncbi:MAG: AMP-binding protein, partial [Actinobacteria bacterium]|nr:AMP-binding protein [Actinomycetota bacterium]